MTHSDPHEVYLELIRHSNEMMHDLDIEPLELAAAFITHAMRISRTVLAEEDYDKMMTSIYDSRDRIEPVVRPVLH